MSDVSPASAPRPEAISAIDRPEGQAHPLSHVRPQFRRRTKWFVACVAAVTISTWLLFLRAGFDLAGNRGVIALILVIFAALAAAVPLQFAFQQELEFDLTILVLAALLLPVQISIPVCILGYTIGYAIRHRMTFILDLPINSGSQALSLALAALAFRLLDLRPDEGALSLARWIEAGAVVALIAIAFPRMLVAAVINFESRQPVRQILSDNTLGMQTGEQAVLGAMIALGIMGAVMAQSTPWALLLLLIPAFALWLALRQNVETRHRIEASLATAQLVAGIGSLDWDLKRGDVRWSESLFDILDYAPGDTQPATDAYLNRVQGEDRDSVMAAFQAATEGRPVEIDHRVRLDNGEERAFNLKFNSVPDRRGIAKRIVGTVHDVTDRKRLEEQLHFQAYHDPLTLLPNRAMFMRKLDQSFTRFHRSRSIALLFLDLDRFKLINDTLGHDAGDHLLRVVGTRLETCIRPNDVVARLGGDEFTVLLHDVAGDAEASAVAERIISAVNQPLTLPGDREVVISTSVGIVRPGPEHASGADLLRDADTALYRAKELGRNQYTVFDRTMGAETSERMILEDDLRSAIANKQFSLLYQPRLDLAGGRVLAVEALIRWAHPSRGDISPLRLITIAEETGQIDAIGRWIMQTAIDEAATWRRVVNPTPSVSINITGKQLRDPAFTDHLAAMIATAGMSASQVRLEAPESAVMKDVEGSILAIGRLQQIGARVAVDEFGSGHSSLASLRRLPVDTLHLDRQFVTEIGANRDATMVAQAVIGLAHGLGLQVVAAGVERQDQVEQLVAIGCEQAQGNYFCAPVPGPELLAFLIRNQQNTEQHPRPTEPPNLRRLRS